MDFMAIELNIKEEPAVDFELILPDVPEGQTEEPEQSEVEELSVINEFRHETMSKEFQISFVFSHSRSQHNLKHRKIIHLG